MFQSLYTFKSSHPETLSFEVSDQFLEIDISKDPNWVHVISRDGNIGYVPKNYVTLNQVALNEMLKFVDACIDAIHMKASKRDGSYLELENNALKILARKRQEGGTEVTFTLHHSKKPAPPPPLTLRPVLTEECVNYSTNDASMPSSSKSTSSELGSSQFPISVKMQCPNYANLKIEASNLKGVDDLLGEKEEEKSEDDPYPAKLANQTAFSETSSLSIRQLQNIIPHDYYSHLVEQIRSVTNISFGASQQVVALILQSLGNTFAPLTPLFENILQDSYKKSEKKIFSTWETSGDGRKLADLLEKLRLCKDDDQQRSWALHEDEFIIKEHLNGILDVLINGDMDACNQVLMLSDYYPLLTLVQYYQMETRWNLQKVLLQIFSSICQMSKRNISYLSSSVLPLELAREIMDSNLMEDELKYIILVLGMLLSMADALPVTHFSIMNENFVNNLFQCIETYNQNPETEALGELYLTLLLAFNLQYHTKFSLAAHSSSDCQKIEKRTENLVIKALSSRRDTKYFIEKILILFNREEDPVHMFDHEPHPPHSILSIMGDIFNCSTTAQLLYTNDEKVLCDIILRQLTDLSSEEKRRCQYLSLLDGVITLGKWKEHQHHREEFISKLKYILEENAPEENNIAARILDVLSKFESSQSH